KAYNTVDWGFLKQTLMGFGFHARMIQWIMKCVTSTSFTLSINGLLHGYFKGQRGLRQGDPMSPYLFTLIMEILTLMLQSRVREDDSFTYHRYCEKLDIINLCFTDDLFLFAHGDADSAQVIMGALDEFKLASRLTPSLPKSTTYFCNVLNHTKLSILNILPFEEGHLPVKYLGVPLISSRLIYRDCKEVIEKFQNRIKDWKNKSLSAAGRLQLVQSVIGSMHCQGDMRRGKAKVALEVVCLPKKEGGLGLRRLDIFNKALMVSHIWSLLSLKESLWVKWIHAYKLKGRNFWDVPIRGNMTWGRRKVLQLHPIIREFIWFRIGDGSKHLFNNGKWTWPHDWISKYPALATIVVPTIVSNAVDELEWCDSSGTTMGFSVSSVWECIRPRGDEITWCDVVWFSNCIPQHAFHLWLAIKRKLKTQDNMRQWGVSVM
ncbi:putative reverse transcriptase domain, reverse transcriptase zinc-binding domain protein, partial [Tanacetum coccineum]